MRHRGICVAFKDEPTLGPRVTRETISYPDTSARLAYLFIFPDTLHRPIRTNRQTHAPSVATQPGRPIASYLRTTAPVHLHVSQQRQFVANALPPPREPTRPNKESLLSRLRAQARRVYKLACGLVPPDPIEQARAGRIRELASH